MRPIKVKEPCFKFARQDIKVESTNGTIVEDGSVDKMMTFITEVQNIVNDTSIPRPIRNKLFNDMQSDTGLEINPQQIFELAMRGRYGVANERIINSLKESIKKNDVFEKVKIDKIYKDDLKNQEMVVKRQLSKSIKNEITFEKKLHDEVPSGKNYIIKNIKGKDFIVVKNLEGQNKETLVNSILSDHFADVGFRKIVGDSRYLGLVKNIVNSKEPHIKKLVDKHRGNGKQSTELFNSVVSDLLESDKTLSLKTYEHVTGLLSNAIRNYIPKYGRPYSMSELKHILGTSVNLYKGKPNQLIDKLKIKNYFGGDSVKGEKINLYMNKGMKQIYDKQMFDIMSNMSNFLKFESIRAKKGTKVDVDIPDFVTRLNRLLYTARVSGIDFGLDVKTLSGKNIITEIDNFVNKTLRVKFPKEVEKILNEKVISDKKIVEMQKFIEKSKEYKNLTKVGEEYLPYLRNINRESFDYQGINSVDELKQEWHQYKSLHARAISGFFKGLSKLDNRLYSTERLSEHLIKSYEKGKITEDFALEIANIRNATNIPRSHRISNSKIGNMLEVELTHMERAPSAALTKIEDIYFKMTQTEPLLGVYLKAINDTFDALSFSKLKKDKLDVDTFKDLVLEYAMIRGSKFPVSPRLWLGDKLKDLKNTSESNLEILLSAIKEGDNAIMDFNFTMTGRRDPTYLGVVFDIAKAQQQKPAIQKLTKESFLKGSDEFKLEEVIAEFERKGIDEKYYKDLGEEGKVKNDAVFHEYKLKKQKEFLSEFRALASTDVMSMFEQTSTSKLNADIKENMLARAKGVVKEGDTVIDGTKIISKEAKRAYADFLRKKAKGDGAELKLREASSFAKKQTPLTPYEMKDFVIRNAEEYLHTYANRRAHIVAHNKAYGHIEAVRGKPKVDEDGKVIKNEETGAIEYEGDVYLNNYFERRERQYKDNPDALEALKLLKTVHSQVIGTYGKGEKGFLNSSMKAISQTLIMSWLGKNYQWAIVEGTAGLSALGEGGILKGVKLYSKIMQNPVLKKEFDSIINKREFHSNVTRLLQNQFGDHIVDLFDKDIMATVTKNSQILNGNAALSDGFRVAHSYLAKSDLDKLIIDGDKDMLKIFNSMGISTTHIKELKTMLKGAPMIKEEGVYGFEPSFIKGNSKLLNLYSKVLNTYIGNYSIHKTATAIPDFQQTGIGRFLLLFRSFEQSLYSSMSRSVQAGDSRAIQRIMMQVAGTMFLQSYRAGKYYNYDRDGDKIAIDLILNSGMIGTTGVALDFIYQGIARNRISLAPLSATQALLQDGRVPIPFSSNPIVEIIDQGL